MFVIKYLSKIRSIFPLPQASPWLAKRPGPGFANLEFCNLNGNPIMPKQHGTFHTAAYGGPGWPGRETSLRQEIGTLWRACGLDNEWAPLKEVLLHCPGSELILGTDADAALMLAPPDAKRAAAQHEAMAQAYRGAGVAVHTLEPQGTVRPNQMFLADLFFMTPEGAILARPASSVRAGEEVEVQRRLAALGIPMVRTLRGNAAFEGADAMWLDRETVLLGRGLRTNAEGIAQVTAALGGMGVTGIPIDLPFGTMHMMGMLRILDRDLALAWPRRTPYAAVEALRARGFRVEFLTELDEAETGKAFNIVTLGPRRILMPAGNPKSQAFYEGLGVTCTAVATDELAKAAGAMGCLTGILRREMS